MAQEDDFRQQVHRRALPCSASSTRAKSAPAPPGRWCRKASTATSSSLVLDRVSKNIVQGNPLDTDTMVGAQASSAGAVRQDHGLSWVSARDEGAALPDGRRESRGNGQAISPAVSTCSPPCLQGTNRHARSSRKRSSGRPSVSVRPLQATRRRRWPSPTTTEYGLGAGRLDPGHQPGLSAWAAAYQGGTGVDELLPRCTRPTPPSAVTSNRALAVRRTR